MSERRKILIVDDEPHFRFAAQLALRRAGYDVLEAGDGLEAFNKITLSFERGEPCELLVTDIQMPVLGGLELIEYLATRGIRLPTLIVTGFLDDSLLIELKRRKFPDYLEKPLSPEELVKRVDSMFGVPDSGDSLRVGEG